MILRLILRSLWLLSSLTPPLSLPLPLPCSLPLLCLALVRSLHRLCGCSISRGAASGGGSGFPDPLQALLSDLSCGQLLFLVPPPLVDLALAKTRQLRQVEEALLRPVGITSELVFKYLHLVVILAFPSAYHSLPLDYHADCFGLPVLVLLKNKRAHIGVPPTSLWCRIGPASGVPLVQGVLLAPLVGVRGSHLGQRERLILLF